MKNDRFDNFNSVQMQIAGENSTEIKKPDRKSAS